MKSVLGWAVEKFESDYNELWGRIDVECQLEVANCLIGLTGSNVKCLVARYVELREELFEVQKEVGL